MEYETTHPWLTFDARALLPQADDTAALQDFFFKMGEISSKAAHLSASPLMPATMEQLNKIYLSKGVAATTAIEGNTLGEDYVRRLMDNAAEHAPRSQAYQEQEVRNIYGFCRDLEATIAAGEPLPPVSLELINKLHFQVLQGVEGEDTETIPGCIRSHSVGVGHYRGAPAQDCEYLVRRLAEWLNSPIFNPPNEDWVAASALIQAIAAHVYLVWIHPYGNGNGRTARLLEYYLLMRAGLPAPACHLLSDHYNRTREEYYRLLTKSSAKHPYNISEFILYALQGFQDGLRQQIDLIQSEQSRIIWRQLVHSSFAKQRPSESLQRRRKLAFFISDAGKPLSLGDIGSLPPVVFDAYRRLTSRALARDLNALVKMGLIRETAQGYVPCTEQVHAMRPLCAPRNS